MLIPGSIPGLRGVKVGRKLVQIFVAGFGVAPGPSMNGSRCRWQLDVRAKRVSSVLGCSMIATTGTWLYPGIPVTRVLPASTQVQGKLGILGNPALPYVTQ